MKSICQNERETLHEKNYIFIALLFYSLLRHSLRRREKQLRYNELHHITPRQITKDIKRNALGTAPVEAEAATASPKYRPYIEEEHAAFAADPIVQTMSRGQLEKSIANTTRLMKKAAKELDFIQAAQFRDELLRLQAMLEEKQT